MATSPIQPTATATAAPANSAAANAGQAADAFGLSFESLLKIILTQLTYQDPLKPMDNFQFVSQLAQFSQVQQGQVISDRLLQMVSAQATLQATSLLGKRVDVPTSGAAISGTVKAVSFDTGDPRITVVTDSNQTISNLALSAVTQIREGN